MVIYSLRICDGASFQLTSYLEIQELYCPSLLIFTDVPASSAPTSFSNCKQGYSILWSHKCWWGAYSLYIYINALLTKSACVSGLRSAWKVVPLSSGVTSGKRILHMARAERRRARLPVLTALLPDVIFLHAWPFPLIPQHQSIGQGSLLIYAAIGLGVSGGCSFWPVQRQCTSFHRWCISWADNLHVQSSWYLGCKEGNLTHASKDQSLFLQGETWSMDGSGNRYQKWWGENHFGDGWVQKYGNSTTGENWDVREQMDTYYNPIPHFDYRLALDHSPTLKQVPALPRAGDDLGEGIDCLWTGKKIFEKALAPRQASEETLLTVWESTQSGDQILNYSWRFSCIDLGYLGKQIWYDIFQICYSIHRAFCGSSWNTDQPSRKVSCSCSIFFWGWDLLSEQNWNAHN